MFEITVQMVDLLFDYTYNLGEAELASDQDIEVKTRFETTEALGDLGHLGDLGILEGPRDPQGF